MKIDVQLFMRKKIIYSLITLLFISVSYKGQRHEIGVQLGMSNLVGDIGRTNYILQKPVLDRISDYGVPLYAGILYRMNFNPYQTVRLNIGYSNVQFIDALAKENYRRFRNLSGANSNIEADLIFEYNFFPVNNEQKSLLSPYVFGGVGGMLAKATNVTLENDFKRDSGGNAIAPKNSQDFTTNPKYTSGQQFTMAIPFGVGLKYKFNYNWALFGEFMFRPTFSDAIDYSVVTDKSIKQTYNKDIVVAGSTKSLLQESPYKEIADARAEAFLKDRQIGNINSKDWVNTVSIGLTYSFGRPPCYCEQ
jgi:opacity protein-like surface antigen